MLLQVTLRCNENGFPAEEADRAYISDICLTRLSLEIRKLKEAALTPEQKEAKEHFDEAVDQFVEEHSVDNVLAKADEETAKAKAKGKRKSSKPKAPAKKKQKEEKEKVTN